MEPAALTIKIGLEARKMFEALPRFTSESIVGSPASGGEVTALQLPQCLTYNCSMIKI